MISRLRMTLGVCLAIGLLILATTPSYAQQNPVLDPSLNNNQKTPMLLQADELIYDNKNNKVLATGNVEVFYKKHTLLADRIVYDRNDNVLIAEGNVRIKEPDGAVVKADRIRLTDDFREGFINSLRIRTSDDASITADRATRTEGNRTVFENGSFTPCKVCEKHPEKAPVWQVKAERVIHDKDQKTIEYENARFEFLGVPIAWIPYFKHADPSRKRQSGFLIPSAYHSDNLGFVGETPYYLAVAPNMDATITPVATTKAGGMLKGKWRHRLANGTYTFDVAGAFDDTPEDNQPTDQKLRGSLVTTGNFKLGSFWNFGWDATVESDEQFRRFYKLDDVSTTDRVSQIYLTGQSERNYFAMHSYHFGGLVVDDDSGSNSIVHPVIDYNYILNNPVLGGELSFNANAVSMSRDDASPSANWSDDWRHVSEKSNRITAEMAWRRELIDPIGQVFTPFVQARGDFYHFNNPDEDEDKTETHGTGLAGLEYRYPFIANMMGGSHILEPVGQVSYRPDSDKLQNRLPNEDAQSLVFDDTLLFDSNKFSGYDRLETGVRANVGLRYTANFQNGGNIRAVFGQSYHLTGKNPFEEASGSGLDTKRSDYVGGLYFEPSKHFGLVAQGRFDQDSFELRRTDAHAWLNYGPFSTSASYVNQRPKLGIEASDENTLRGEELYGNLGIRLTSDWSLTGNVRYDFITDRIERHGAGLTYSDECFLFGLSYDRTTPHDDPANNQHIDPDTTIAFKVQFKHLGGLETSTDVDSLLANK